MNWRFSFDTAKSVRKMVLSRSNHQKLSANFSSLRYICCVGCGTYRDLHVVLVPEEMNDCRFELGFSLTVHAFPSYHIQHFICICVCVCVCV